MKAFLPLALALAIFGCASKTPAPTPNPVPANPPAPSSGLPKVGKYEVVGKLPKALEEGSGMAYSQKSKRLYTVNDSGGGPEIFVTDAKGASLGTLTVYAGGKKVSPEDWEAMAWGPCPGDLKTSCLFIGDIGDNDESRSKVQLLYFPEPAGATGKVEAKVMNVTYPAGKVNAEGLAVHPQSGIILITSKTYDKNKTLQKIFKVDDGQAKFLMNIPGVMDEVGAFTISPNGLLGAVSESSGQGHIVIFNWKGEYVRIKSLPLGQEEMLEFISDTELLHSTEMAGAPLVKITVGQQSEPLPTPTPAPTPVPGNPTSWYVPSPGMKYQVMDEDDGDYVKQLKAGTQLVTIEGIKKDYGQLAQQVKALKEKGVKVICYQSLSYEPWRADISQFPSAAKGKKMKGWDEWWSDTRVTSPAHPFWDKRYDQLAKAGCDCVEDDNEVDPKDNESGFPLSDAEAIASYKRRADYAHKVGMCHIAKNNPSMSAHKAKYSDGVMIEEAHKYNERASYLPWKEAGKYAAMVEYSSSGCKPYPGFSVQYHPGGDYFDAISFKDCD